MISRTKLGFVAVKCVPVCPDMPIQDGSDFVRLSVKRSIGLCWLHNFNSQTKHTEYEAHNQTSVLANIASV